MSEDFRDMLATFVGLLLLCLGLDNIVYGLLT